MQAPWTEIGRLESDVREIKNKLASTVERHQVEQINRNVTILESNTRKISSLCAELRYDLETLREEVRTLIEVVEVLENREV